MGFFDLVSKNFGQQFAATVLKKSSQNSRGYGTLLTACAILSVFIPDIWVAFLHWWSPTSSGASVSGPLGEHVLRWSLSLAPSAVILHHALHVLHLRRNDFPTQMSPEFKSPQDLTRLKELYFGGASIAIKFGIPLVLTSGLCSTMMAGLLDLETFSSWLPGIASSSVAGSVHRALALGFVGAYLYVILLLTQRAFRRDVTTGVALWIATMFVAGPLTAGVFSLFWKATADTGSVSVDVVYLVAGMLPRQFATIAQGLARRILQPSAPSAPARALPLSNVRGISAEIEERLAEEGITDVATLAYADPYLLLRTTSFDRRQIVNWIDEAQLIIVFPDHWQALEKSAFTGAMDIAWARNSPILDEVAADIKFAPTLLKQTAQRLWDDAQIQDLYAIYWQRGDQELPANGERDEEESASNKPPSAQDPQPLIFTIDEVPDVDQQAIIAAIRGLSDVTSLDPVESRPRMWRAYIRAEAFGAVVTHLVATPHVKVQQQ
jgi:hypothetical protein